MIIVFYHNYNGRITRCHEVKNMDAEDIQRATEKYNLDHPDQPAEFLEVEEGSLEEFLFLRGEQRMKLDRETLDDLKNAADEVQSLILDLMMQMDEVKP